jgi:predicted nucleic acid-binding protein
LGVVLAARNAGLIPEARAVFEALAKRGLRLRPEMLDDLLRLVGE